MPNRQTRIQIPKPAASDSAAMNRVLKTVADSKPQLPSSNTPEDHRVVELNDAQPPSNAPEDDRVVDLNDAQKPSKKPSPTRSEKSPAERARTELDFSRNLSTRCRADITERLEKERSFRSLNPSYGRDKRVQYIIDEAMHLGLLALEKKRKK